MRACAVPLVLATLATLATFARAQGGEEPSAALPASLRALRQALPAERGPAVEHLLTLAPDEASVRALLADGAVEGIEPEVEAGTWLVREVVDEKGVKRPYQLYLPASRAGRAEPLPLLVSLHGGVSRPEFVVQPGTVGTLWPELAEADGFAIACPLGRTDTTWWTDAGADAIHAVVRDVKRLLPIDDDRIGATGFSDGGSGCYWLALAGPDPFACLLPMNGHPAVAASVGQRPLYLRNVFAVPMFVAMTQDDQLYPAYTVLPHLLPVMKADGPLTLVCWPDGGHSPSYFDAMGKAFADWFLATPRDPWPAAVDWWCSDPALGRRAWVEVDAIGPAVGDADALPDLNVESSPGRVLIGVTIDREYAGPGVKVEQVQEDSLAVSLGMRAGDVITRVDQTDIAALDDLRAVLSAKTYGDAVALTWTREGKEQSGAGSFPPFEPEPIYLRDGPIARVSARARPGRIELTTRNVVRLRLLLPPEWLAADGLEVVANGRPAAHKVRVIALEEVLRRYAVSADGSRLPAREVTVELEPAGGAGG